jgi:amino acid permease
MPNKFFGWLEYFGSLVKVFLFIFITLVSLAIIGGAGPKGYVRDGSTWTDLPAFKSGFGVSFGLKNAHLISSLTFESRGLLMLLLLQSGRLATRYLSVSWVARPNHLVTPWRTRQI